MKPSRLAVLSRILLHAISRTGAATLDVRSGRLLPHPRHLAAIEGTQKTWACVKRLSRHLAIITNTPVELVRWKEVHQTVVRMGKGSNSDHACRRNVKNGTRRLFALP
jgi:hypothetical protein